MLSGWKLAGRPSLLCQAIKVGRMWESNNYILKNDMIY
ncbi:hypothetical protein V6Z11_A10G072100 [Gossypium hirsutum]